MTLGQREPYATIRAVIVDDEAPARAKLRRLMSEHANIAVVGEAPTGQSAVELVRRLRPDVLFLDVQMPGMDGFDVVSHLEADAVPLLVFVTAHHEHAVRAFEVRAFDYLLKPLSPTRFDQVAARIRDRLSAGADRAAFDRVQALLRDVRGGTYLRHVIVHAENRSLFLAVDRIDWVESRRNNVAIHAGPQEFVERLTLTRLLNRLDPRKFLRISRSTAVRIEAVKELHPWSHGDYHVVLHSGVRLTWSRRYRALSGGMFEL